jgi:hypothetical protein
MSIPIFGVLVIALGVWCQFGTFERALVTMFALTPLAGVAALDLPALGGASITPANFFILFYLLRIVAMRDGTTRLVAEVGPRRPLFVFLMLIIWILGSAILLPRLFAGMTDVFSLERTLTPTTGTAPLRPTSGNVSQGVYAAGGFAVACVTSAFARQRGGAEAALRAIIVVTGIDMAFAVVDLVANAVHAGFVLDIVHTANYSFLAGDEVGGVKRLTGSFTEASAFAFFSMSLLGLNLSLFVMNLRPRFTGPATILLTIFIVLSTSSAGYAGLGALYGGFFLYAVVMALTRRRKRPIALALMIGGAGFLALAIVVLFVPSVAKVAWNVIDQSLIQKGASDSAYERGLWNAQAIQIFRDTYGLGAGIGSTRVSNYVLVLLSNLGVIGLVLFVILMIWLLTGPLANHPKTLASRIAFAARSAILASLVPPLFVGTIYDLGTMFYLLVGLAASGIGTGREARHPAVARCPRAMSQ